MPLPTSQVNSLGKRLRSDLASDEDIAALASYQEEFQPLFRSTITLVGDLAKASGGPTPFGPTGRIKQLRSIVEKLQRQSTRLAQLQDIVGCRVVVQTMQDQDRLAAALPANGEWKVYDRRSEPQHGYRAIHAVRSVGNYRVEVQIRTLAQHVWAELSEALDRYSPGLKYGQGPADTLDGLDQLSQKLAGIEQESPAEDALLSDQFAGERTALMIGGAVMLVLQFLKSKRKKQP